MTSLILSLGLTSVSGFYGKIPARGDFVRAGLPRSFTDPWDNWLQTAIADSRPLLGPVWTDAWLEAPIWRFQLPSGISGPHAALGLFMPSIDRAGRHFPLSFVCLAELALPESGWPAEAYAWLDQAEAAGFAALEHDLDPDALERHLKADDATPTEASPPPPSPPRDMSAWWTQGSPRVPATSFATKGLPTAEQFARMLDANTPLSKPESR